MFSILVDEGSGRSSDLQILNVYIVLSLKNKETTLGIVSKFLF